MSDFTTWRSLVDGEEIGVIPDSAIAQYDAQVLDLDDGEGVTSWPDEIGDVGTLTGGTPTYQTDEINGNPAVVFDGTDDELDVDFDSDETQPYTIIIVAEIEDDDDDRGAAWGTPDGSREPSLNKEYNNGWVMYGDDEDATFGGQPPEQNEIITNVVDDDNTELRINGSSQGTGTFTDDLDGLLLGQRGDDFNDSFTTGPIAEVMLYDDGLDSDEIDDEEERLSDKWGIDLS